MAFGDLKGTLSGASSGGTGVAATGSVSVAVGDLIFMLYGMRANTPTGAGSPARSDDLGNTYNLLHESTTGGGRVCTAYSIVTAGGTLTTATWAHTSNTADDAHCVGVFEGPFDATPLDASITPIADAASPYICPSTGTLAQADELVIACVAQSNGSTTASYAATSPNLKAVAASSGTGANTCSSCLGYQVVSATTAIAPEFTTATSTSGSTAVYSFKKGSSAKTLTIDSGSYAVTGQVVTLSHGWAVAVDGSSYAITGQDVTLARGQVVVVDGESYAIGGQDVSLTKTWLLNVDAGSVAITGQDVALQKGLTLGVDGSSYSINGQDVTLVHDLAIPVDAGSISVSGQDVTLTKTWLLNVDAGSYAISGQDVALSHGWAVSVDASSYSIGGQDVTLTKTGALSIDVDAGSYAISGQDVALAHQWLMDVESGGYLLSGSDVTLTLATGGGGGHVFQCDVFQNNVFQGVCDVTPEPEPEPTPPPDAGGVGGAPRRRGTYTGPAFPRRATRDLYRTYVPPPPEQVIEPKPEAPKPEPVKLGELSATVLPQMMGLTVMHGQAEIDALAAQKRLEQQLMIEDEEAAIIAILAASIY
jgi:hypothetical protein